MEQNIIWISLESVRTDYTSLVKSEIDTTPNLKRIASTDSGRFFSNCFAHARWTPASSSSILTGTYLSSHRVGYEDTTDVVKLPKELSTVPQLLKEQGYHTACFSGNAYVSSATGLDRGFDRFASITKKDFLSLAGASTLGHYLNHFKKIGVGFDIPYHKDHIEKLHQVLEFRRWIKNQAESENSFFGYMHLNNPHHPYRPPLPILKQMVADTDISASEALDISDKFSGNIWELMANESELDAKQRRAVLAAYKGEIQYADYFVGKIFDYVQSRDDIILIITGDHGELFGEDGVFGHNLVLHDKILNVPLVTYDLDLRNVSDDALVQHIDIMQTVLDLVDADTSQFQGYNLTARERDFIIAERGPRWSNLKKLQKLNHEFDTSQFHGEGISCIRSDDWKYIKSDKKAELYCLPDEETNRINDFPEKEKELAGALKERLPEEKFNPVEQAEFDSDMESHLRYMGYID